tara:strand:+ start:432 stop:1022 length:591 start_codon:yes stop_codon:yes gene_type:complete
MMKLVFATTNSHKLDEVRAMLPDLEIVDLKSIDFTEEVKETGSSFEENAYIKAKAVFDFCGLPTMAEDSGLCCEGIGGDPGIYTARYGGLPVDHNRNMDKLLLALEGKSRKAFFRTVACFILKEGGEETSTFFDGEIHGKISQDKRGDQGFGYDPIFVPEHHTTTFAEMSDEDKASMSHRGRAMLLFGDYIKNLKM